MVYADEVEKSLSMFQRNECVRIMLNWMRRGWESKCDGDSCCVLPIKERSMNIDGECPQLHIGISARAASLCPSCKSQEQRESEGIDYAVLLDCIPIPTATHTLFSADRLLHCGICDGLHGYELLRCIPYGIWLHVSRGNCIGCISSLFFNVSTSCLSLSHTAPFFCLSCYN